MKNPGLFLLFTATTAPPLALAMLGAGGLLPGAVWLALGWMTGLAVLADRLIRRETAALPEAAAAAGADMLSVALGLGHFVLLALVVPALAGGSGLGWGERAGLFFAAGLWFGQVSNSNAHELIHRRARGLFWLGAAIYASLLFGHHASAHRKIHHRFVATDRDPNSARPGESFYHFAPRAWWGSFLAGWRAERAAHGPNPYPAYLGAALASLIGAFWLAGAGGIAALVALAAYAQTQLLLSDYVQHYGLRRAMAPDGRAEPLTEAHSWNAPHWFTSLLMLHAPRHSDHHAHPGRPYPALRLPPPGAAPRLPHSLPVMAVIALFPGLWRRVMRRELDKWRRMCETGA